MKRFVSCLVVTFVVSGCGSPVKTVSNIELEKGRTAVFNIPTSLVGENPAVLASKYATAVGNASTYKRVFKNNYGFSLGVRISQSENAVDVSYVRENGTATLKNNFTAKFLLTTKKVGDSYSVVAECPSNIVNDTLDLSGGPSWDSFLKKEDVIDDLNRLCANAEFVFSVTENGEVNASFNDSSVFANFQRKLKRFNPSEEQIKQYDLQKSTWFNFQDGNQKYEIAVSVFPYRNGSKVVYKNIRNVTCRPSKPCDFDAEFGNRLRAMITSIANE